MRRRLALVAAAVTTMVALAFLIPLARLVDQLAEDRVMTQAERDAQLVAQFIGAAGAGNLEVEQAFNAVTVDGTLGGRPVTLLLPEGRIIGAALHHDDDLTEAFAGAAIRIPSRGGQVVAVPTVLASGDVAVVRVFATDSELNAGVARSWVILGLLGALLVLIGIAVTDRLARSMVAPVEALSDAAGKLAAGDLSTVVEPDGPPELLAVAEQFNRLTTRVRTMLQQERETAADLSHRLRTPLAALRLDIESLPPSDAREQLAGDLDELERSITHVINEARRPLRTGTDETADLRAIVVDRHEFWLALAEEQGRAAMLQAPGDEVLVKASPGDLVAAVDALYGNVLAHTPAGCAYRTELFVADGRAVLRLSDDGPGFTDPEALSRGRSTSGSTGLGLDIVRRTAIAAGGELTIANRAPRGAVAEVALPLAGG